MEAKVTKVSTTKAHEGSQKGVFNVCRGKLVLIHSNSYSELMADASGKIYLTSDYHNTCTDMNYKYIHPIIISETEVILIHDKRYAKDVGIMDTSVNEEFSMRNNRGIWSKILALPENFSPKQLTAIMDGKLKDGDEVLIECETIFLPKDALPSKQEHTRIIRLTDNHIKLFPAKMLSKTYSGEELEQIVFDAMKYAHGMGISKDGVGGREGVKRWIKTYQDGNN